MYKIEITKIEKVETKQRQQWVSNGENSGYSRPPETELEDVETNVLTQTVEDLNLKKVILAVNNIESLED